MISSAGHNISPANIEAHLKSATCLIAHACCIGDDRGFNVALIVLNHEAARRPAPDGSIDLAREPAVLEEVVAGVARAQVVIRSQWPSGVRRRAP